METFRATAVQWLRGQRTALLESALIRQHDTLRQRLQAAVLDLDAAPEPARQGTEHLIPAGYTAGSRGPVLLALPLVEPGKPVFLGALTGTTVGAQTCWLLADELLRLREFHPLTPVVLLLDASGHAMTRLDENRAQSQLARKAGVDITAVTNVAIWGNHSSTQFPDFYNAKINGEPATDSIKDETWLKGDFITTVQQRGAEAGFQRIQSFDHIFITGRSIH
jgi:hypothetical protein